MIKRKVINLSETSKTSVTLGPKVLTQNLERLKNRENRENSGSFTDEVNFGCTFVFSQTPSYYANQAETFRKITL